MEMEGSALYAANLPGDFRNMAALPAKMPDAHIVAHLNVIGSFGSIYQGEPAFLTEHQGKCCMSPRKRALRQGSRHYWVTGI